MGKKWTDLHLLRDYSQPGSNRQRVRRLFDEIAALALFPSTTTFWRGHSVSSYLLQPSLLRKTVITPAGIRDLLATADRASLYWRQGILIRDSNEFEKLSVLQHTGTPTPLIDLTADPLVSLYFAAEKHDNDDGLLIGFNADDRWIDQTHSADTYERLTYRLRSEGQVGWLVPPVISDRVVVQRARLMIAPVADSAHWADQISDVLLPSMPPDWDASKLDALFNDTGSGRRSMPPVVALTIPKDLKEFIRDSLATNYGISHESLFPEPEGFALKPS